MKSIIKLMCISTLFLGSATESHAQEPVQEQEKVGFFKRAFNDMKESTRRQREIDRANFKAHKLEAKASFQEHKALNSRDTRKAIEEKEYEKQMQEAKARQEAAEKRIEEAKQSR
jgi:hypothetical protein